MPKSKKRKTNHKRSTNADGDLNHAEIWDDSALIRSWNDAVAEYEYYHSIHAKGEDVEEVLRQAELEEEQQQAAAQLRQQDTTDNTAGASQVADRDDDNEIDANGDLDLEDGEIDDEASIEVPDNVEGVGADADRAIASQNVRQQQNQSREALSLPDSGFNQSQQPAKPQQIQNEIPTSTAAAATTTATTEISPTSDQTLENLKMAYYWAGYYSGLHDAQRQQQQKPAE